MTKPKVISLFSGAGGLDYGFEAAGFDTVALVEMNHDCCDTLRKNRKWNVIEDSIFNVRSERLLSDAGVKRGDLDVVIGGPPCQPFSKAGYWATGDARRLDDPRADTLAAYMRVVEDVLPKAFVLENVQGLTFSGKDEGVRLLLDRVRRINRKAGTSYRISMQVVSAATFGVPQFRERVILVGSREGIELDFPSPTHGPSDGLKPYVTAWDALADIRPDRSEDLALRGKWADLLPSIPEGHNYLWHTDRGQGLPLFGWRRRYWTFLLKLAKEKPSWTIQAQPGPAIGPFHWSNRRLSRRELCRLQTFPDDVEIVGSHSSVQKQLGNAVPSLLGEVLAVAIKKQLLNLGGSRQKLRLLRESRGDCPPPEDVERVPDRFKKLAGKHDPHPGTGKGYGAIARVAKAESRRLRGERSGADQAY